MRIHPFDLAPVLPEDVVFRESRLWALLGVIVLAVLMAGAVILWMNGVVALWIGAVALTITALIMWPLMWKLLEAFSTANWVLRLYGQRILLKIGPPPSSDPSRVFVVEFQSREIQSVCSHRQTTTINDADGTRRTSATTWLELRLRDVDLEELRSCIRAATAPTTRHWKVGSIPMSVSSSSPSAVPVSVTSDGVVRVAWSSPHLVVAPSLKRALQLLGKGIPVLPKVIERNDFTKSDADKAKMEQQIVEFLAQGQTLQATELARQRYGYSLTEARQFVADLQGKDNPPALRDPAARWRNGMSMLLDQSSLC